jgi:phage terminase small subunit
MTEASETGRPIKLTAKQQVFVNEYIIDLNATQAAIRAGYSEDTAYSIGSENLSKPEIQEFIQQAMNMRAVRLGITSDYVLATVVETINRCRQVEPVLDRRGDQIYVKVGEEGADQELKPAFAFDAKGVLKGCELLGKHLKLFADRVEHTGKDGEPLIPEPDTTELARRIAFLLTSATDEPTG